MLIKAGKPELSSCHTAHIKRIQMHSALFCGVVAAAVALTACYPAIAADTIRIMAKNALGRIKKIKDEHFQMSPVIDFEPDIGTPMEGLGSIFVYLNVLQKKLEVSPPPHLRQLDLDLKILVFNLESMALSLDCALPQPAIIMHKDKTAFPITANYLLLLNLQRYLEKLCLNLEMLKSC